MTPNKSSINQSGCSPVSSNCVIWQGPDIACINLQKGDTVSEVVFKLAEEVTELKSQLDLSDVDLKCLVQQCATCPDPDKSLHAILNIMIDEICNITGGNGSDAASGTSAELVKTAQCFQIIDENGDPVLNMSPNEYIRRIGIQVCQDITALAALTTTVQGMNVRLTILENYVHPENTNPEILASCIFPNATTPIDIVEAFEEMETQFCNLRAITGLPTPLAQAVAQQCVGLNTDQAFSLNAPMSALPGWKSTVTSVADSINNLWITICDMRSGMKGVLSGVATGCALVTVDFSVTLSGSGVNLSAQIVFAGHTSIPDTYKDCNTGSVLTIKDAAGSSYTYPINVSSLKNTSNGISISLGNTPLNTASNYTFTLASCLTDGTNSCEKTNSKAVSNISLCPAVTLNSDAYSVSYSFTNTASSGTSYVIDLMDANGTQVLSTQAKLANQTTLSGSFTGLSAQTTYNVRITINNGAVPFVCNNNPIATKAVTCAAPSNVIGTFINIA
jgi:hypothetical protein